MLPYKLEYFPRTHVSPPERDCDAGTHVRRAQVAVKLQERTLVDAQDYEANVRREIAILQSVRHPAIIQLVIPLRFLSRALLSHRNPRSST